MRIPATAAALFALASCASPAPPPPPPVVAPPRPVVTPAPTSSDWRDWPLTPGDWNYTQDARGSLARFGRAGSDAELTLRCDRNLRQIYLSRRADAAGTLTVRTSSLLRPLATQPTGTPGYVAVALGANDALLDAMGFSRGRFVIEQAGRAPLVLPAWPEILRVTEDCRG